MSDLESNPFASPLASGEARYVGAPDFRNDLQPDQGKLRAAIGAEFPDRCVKCNAPADGYRLKRALSWHPSWVYILIFVALLLYVLVALVLRKQATYHVGLCEVHRQKRRTFQVTIFALAAAGVIGLIASFMVESFGLGMLSVLGIIGALLVGAVGSQVISAAEITPEYTMIKGCGPEFLASLV